MKQCSQAAGWAFVLPAAFVIAAAVVPVSAWNHSEIEWRTIETAHFSVHFHEEVEGSAREVARIAEEIWGPVTSLYGYEPDRVHINVTDRAGLPEGASYYYLNRIDINPDDVEFHLRGTAVWLRNVVTHEFSHMVSLQAAMKMPRWLPAIYLQAFGFEREKRPDVITGYPNFVGSLPIAGEVVPNWLAEGVAQYQTQGARNDIWDSHRDMVLRCAALGGTLLDLDRMGVFGKNSLEAELVYNQGYSLVRYIASVHGTEAVVGLIDAQGAWHRTGFSAACRSVLGISADELYEAWKREVTERYQEFEARVLPSLRAGSREAGEGFINMHPVARGGRVYYASNRGRDYRDVDLVLSEGYGVIRPVAEGISSGADLSADGRSICFARRTDDNPYGYQFEDIFILDTETGNERRLTRGAKATDPSFSPGGGRIVAVVSADCGDRLVVLSSSGGDTLSELIAAAPGRRFFTPSWGPRGILVSLFEGTSRDIALIDPDTGGITTVEGSAADERDPRWITGGEGFLFSSDRTGVFNIYRAGPDGSRGMVTDVIGGAFQPFDEGEDLLFASYGPGGYEIHRLAGWRPAETAVRPGRDDEDLSARRTAIIGCPSAAADTIPRQTRPFTVTYTPPFLFPRLMVYDGSFRVGLALDSRDYIDRQSVYAAGSAGFDGEFDAQLGFEVRRFKPTFRFDLLRMRKYHEYVDPLAGDVTVRYDLWDAYFSCVLELDEPTPFYHRSIALLYNHGEYGLNINAWRVYDYEIGWTYYKADEVSLRFDYRSVRREVTAQINPRRGRSMSVHAKASRARLQSGEFEYSFQPRYDENNFSSLVAAYEEYIPLPFWSHALTLYGRIGWIDRERIDDFFYLYLGSRDGLRGYSYYSVGGAKNAMARATWRFPLVPSIERQLPVFYLKSLYGALFAEAGKAWNENTFDLRGNLKDVGYELRLDGFTFFSYPLAVTFIGAYGLDTIEYLDPFSETVVFEEGKEWRYYGSVLFSF